MTRDSTHTFEISGDAGLRAAQEIAAALREAIAANQAISIATDAISTADITTIQLLLAARKLAQASGKSLSLATAPSGTLRNLLIETGVLDADGRPLTPGGDFWSPISSPAKGKAQ